MKLTSDQVIAAQFAHRYLSEARVSLRLAASLIEDPATRAAIRHLIDNDLEGWRWKAEQVVREEPQA